MHIGIIKRLLVLTLGLENQESKKIAGATHHGAHRIALSPRSHRMHL